MHQSLYSTSLIAFVATLIPICWSAIGPLPDEDGEVVAGHKQVMQNAFNEIVERRRRATHEQVVDMDFNTKENKSITALSQAEKDYLVLVHNAYRSAVEPFAASMMEVVWDDDIAAFSQDWANQCTAEHRGVRNLNSWINMGENIYWIYSGQYHEGYSTKFWWDEVQWYNYTTMKCVPGKMCGHYVTLTWAATNKIGCGVNRCARLWALPDYGRGAYYFVCNYSGRFISHKRPYVDHRTICSYCYRTSAPKCRYNLCVTQEMLNNDIGYNGSTAEIGFNRIKTFSSPKSPQTSAPPTVTSSLPTSPEESVATTATSTDATTARFTVPSTDATTARFTVPSTDATTARFTVPSTDATTARFTVPSTDATTARFTVPSTDATTARFTVPSTDATTARSTATSTDSTTARSTATSTDATTARSTVPSTDATTVVTTIYSPSTLTSTGATTSPTAMTPASSTEQTNVTSTTTSNTESTMGSTMPTHTTPKDDTDKPFLIDAVDEIINSGNIVSSLSMYTFLSFQILILCVIYSRYIDYMYVSIH